MERTVVLIKPDAVSKGFIGRIIRRFDKEKPFFTELKSFMTSTPIMAMLWEGEEVIKRVRKLCGPTDATKAPKGTIRGDYGEDVQRNAIHASEDDHAASKEMDLIFLPHEIQEWKR